MLSQLTVVLVICFTSLSALPMVVYKNAQFNPTDFQFHLIDTFSVATQNACACQCYTNSLCITSTFIGINQTCVLFSAQIWQGQLSLLINSFAIVLSFPNRTTNISSFIMIEWRFDGDFNDIYGRYNGNPVDNNGSVWISPGYNGYGSAVYFPSNNYSLVNYYVDLTKINFTITAWIWIPYNITPNNNDFFGLFDHCEYATTDECLHIAIVDGKLHLGFFSDDLRGYTQMRSNQWYHAAYVYDRLNSKQYVYLNGILDGNRTSLSPYMGNASQITLGSVPLFTIWFSFHNGYIDNLIFVSRIKNDSEILDEATLVAYYSFDNSFSDSGPNQINNSSGIYTNFDPSGRFNQALLINTTNSSYFQTTGFYYLGQTNYSYSFSLWIYPFVNNGTILQVTSPNGWCVPMIGFNRTGYLTIQTLGSNGIYATSLVNGTSLLNKWTYISMTYSTMNGIRLFVNGSLSNSNNSFSDYVASSQFGTIIIGTCRQWNLCVVNQTKIVPSQFRGKIDELKIYSRELSISEIQQIALT